MSISVTATKDATGKVTGWTVTKNGQQYTITDKNNDGLFNKGDLINCNQGASALNAEDIFNVSYQVQLEENGGKGVSAEDMAKYAEYQKAAEERDAAQADYDMAQRRARLAQRQASQPKKKSFFDKVMPWLNLTNQAAMTAGTIYGAVKGDFWGLGMLGGCNWAFNGGNMADMAGLGFTGLSNTALLNSQLGSNNALWNSMGLNLSGLTGGAAGAASPEKTALTTAQNKVDAIIGSAGKASEADAKSTFTEQQKKSLHTQARDLIDQMKNGSTAYPDANKTKLQELAGAGKEAKDLTDDNAKIIQQIISAPFVDYRLIDIEENGEKPLSAALAKDLNKTLKFVADQNEDKLKELTKAKRNKYNEIVNKITDWSQYTDASVTEFFTWIANYLTDDNKDVKDMPELKKKQ